MIYIVLLAVAIPMQLFGQEYLNQLTPEEEDAGYTLLFNGEDLDDWHSYNGTSAPAAWKVYTTGVRGPRMEVGTGGGGAILTNSTWKNFDLKIEWLTPIGGNSGIFIRYLEGQASES
jgi:hypothetical protein